MRPKLGLLFGLVLVALFAWALLEAQGFRAQARLFPVVIGVTGLSLGLLHLGLELRRRKPAEGAPAQSEDVVIPVPAQAEGHTEDLPPEVRRRRTAALLGWIAVFALGPWLLGFGLAVPLATFAYLKLGAGESWRTSIVYSAASGALFYAVFVYALRIPFQQGVLLSLIRG